MGQNSDFSLFSISISSTFLQGRWEVRIENVSWAKPWFH